MKKTICKKITKQNGAIKLTITFEATSEYDSLFESFKDIFEKNGLYKALYEAQIVIACVEKDVKIKSEILQDTFEIVSKNCVIRVKTEVLAWNIKN